MPVIKFFYFALFCALSYMLFGVAEHTVNAWIVANDVVGYLEAISKSAFGVFISYTLLGFMCFCLYMIVVLGTPRKKSFMIFMFAYMSIGFLFLAFINCYKPTFKEEFNLKLYVLKGNIKDLFTDKSKITMVNNAVNEITLIDKKELLKDLYKSFKSVIKGFLIFIHGLIVGLEVLMLKFVIENSTPLQYIPLWLGSMFLIYAFIDGGKIIGRLMSYLVGMFLICGPFILMYTKNHNIAIFI